MGTTAQKLQAVTAAKADIKAALQEKGGSPSDVLSTYGDEIRAIPVGEYLGSDINFYDYDGTILYAWTLEELANKTALPPLPTNHPRLVAQGWNWTLADLKAVNREMDVGVEYDTLSGMSEFDILLNKRTGLEITCNMVGQKSWGDGSTDSATSHTYASYGEYTIKCDGTALPDTESALEAGLLGTLSDASRGLYKRIFLGSNVTQIGKRSLYMCHSLEELTIPNTVTSIGDYAIYATYKLKHVTAPHSLSHWGTFFCGYCHSMKSLSIPNTITFLGKNSIYFNELLRRVTLPENITSTNEGAFTNLYGIKKITLPRNLGSISTSVLYSCFRLEEVIALCDNLSNIYASAFSKCFSLKTLDFRAATRVPSLASSSAISELPAGCKIIVPGTLYSEWISKTNWVAYKDYIYPASEVTT